MNPLLQVHNVLLRHISDLKKVYLLYCNIGGDDSGVLHRMEVQTTTLQLYSHPNAFWDHFQGVLFSF